MTSPISSQDLSTETSEVSSLTLSMKIFAATTIIVCVSVVAVAFWEASFAFGFLGSKENSTIDERLFDAPMPTLIAQDKNPSIETSLPSLSQMPTIDEGSGKYTQLYSLPISETVNSPKVTEKPSLEKR